MSIWLNKNASIHSLNKFVENYSFVKYVNSLLNI